MHDDDASTAAFYDSLAARYHLIYADWEGSIARQAAAIDAIVRERWPGAKSCLDAACGIGTQSLGLAALGYAVTGSDLSPAAVERARREAASRGVAAEFSVCDMRQLAAHHRHDFDLVIACDNSVPHLLSDDEIVEAFRQFRDCLRTGGGCVISVRDYDAEEKSGIQIKPHGVRVAGGVRHLVFQVWEFSGPTYETTFYFVEDRGDGDCSVRAFRSMYYAIGIERLMELMRAAGFADVVRIDGSFFQPVIAGTWVDTKA
ncbi:MAG TPA: class I SAM-dependent methyltransferase [Thermoanaerobaculia bacterium]|nr:class I SAM-dependent methyltransferase [Thermoanaerobaculia bacterium]